MNYPWLTTTPVVPSTEDNRWKHTTPVSPIRKVSTYVELPPFIYVVDSGWLGASYIRAEYGYSARRAFSFKGYIPKGINYLLAVRWTDSNGVNHRYKLWEDVSELLYVPLYSGERIGPNFFLEIWTTEDSPLEVSNDEILRLTLGILVTPTCICDSIDLVEATPVENSLLWALLGGWNPSLDESLVFNLPWQGLI